MLGELFKGMRLTGRHFLSKKMTIQYPEEKTPLVAALPRPARAAPLRERRGALHRLQAVRGGLPGAGDHDRERRPRRRLAPDDALRHRPHQVHLLRLLRGELPGRLDRRDAHPRVPRREARRPLLHQGHAARRRRPLRERDRCGEGGGREIPLTAALPRTCAASRRGATPPEPWTPTPRSSTSSRRCCCWRRFASSRRGARSTRRSSWCSPSSAPPASGSCCAPSSWRSRWCWSTSAR